MKEQVIDSHAHVDSFNQDSLTFISNCTKYKFILPSTSPQNWSLCLGMTDRFPKRCKVALGIHPWEVENFSIDQVKDILKYRDRIHAVGEIGLDKYEKMPLWERQLTFFKAQLEVSIESNLPMIIHNRKAHSEMISLLLKYNKVSGILHGAHLNHDVAISYQKSGLLLGIGTSILKQLSSKVSEMIFNLSPDSFVLESDAPYMGQSDYSNQPIERVATVIANIKKVTPEEIISWSNTNCEKLFGKFL